MAWTVVRDALLLLAAAPLIYYVIAIFAAARFSARSPLDLPLQFQHSLLR